MHNKMGRAALAVLLGTLASAAQAAYVSWPVVTPGAALVNTTVSVGVTVNGSGCDAVNLDFGDGSSTSLTMVPGTTSYKVDHIYTTPGQYLPSAKPGTGADCSGGGQPPYPLGVFAQEAQNKMVYLQLGTVNNLPASNNATISVSGQVPGNCERAFVNWGDGSSPEPLSGPFPLKAQHAYQQGGNWPIDVKAAPGFKCQGELTTKFYAYPKDAKFSGAALAPGQAKIEPGSLIKLDIHGAGICNDVRIDQGDNTTIELGKVLFNSNNNNTWEAGSLKYAKAGTYTATVKDWGSSACGIVSTQIKVEAPVASLLVPVLPLNLVTVPGAPTKPATKPATPAKAPCKKINKQGFNNDNCTD